MSEFYDDLINDALGDFRAAEATTPGLLPGAAAVRATVKHRRTVRLTTLSVLGALLIATPIAAFAADPHGNNPPPMPADSRPASPVESSAPVESPSSTPSESPSAEVVNETVTLQKLRSTVLDIPEFWTDQCPVKHVKLAGTSETAPSWIGKVVDTNLDDDPALETAALIFCRLGEASEGQVVAFERDASGQIRTMGQVARGDGMTYIRDISPRSAGGVTAEVTDRYPCCGTPASAIRHQQREYAWNGKKFAQVGGPAVWGDPARVTDLQVLVTDVTLGPAVDGKRSGTATVTVKNNGPKPSGLFQVTFANCSFSCDTGLPSAAWGNWDSYHEPLAPGQQAVATVNFSFDANTPGGDIQAHLSVVDIDSKKKMTDPKPDNNQVVFHVRLS